MKDESKAAKEASLQPPTEVGVPSGASTTIPGGPLVGQLIGGRFELLELAGSGGMGTVYRALDRHSGATVAVKLASTRGLNPNEMERFVREANLLALLQHPGVVSYVAHGHTPAGYLYLAMEWLEGEDLAQRLLRGPLSVRDSLLLLRRVADALSLAHRRGIVHRDLKPSNLFLRHGAVERVTLLDFGIARMQNPLSGAGGGAATQTGHVIGTPEYMAPEQARGDRVIGAAADIFALGCVLYECISGQPPFVAEHVAAQLARVLFEEPVALHSVRPDVPEVVSDLVHAMLQKAPGSRPHDASALLSAVERILSSTTFVPSSAEATSRAQRRQLSSMELELMSVVLAMPRSSSGVHEVPGLGGAELDASGSYREELADELRRLGMRVTWRKDGSLLAIIGGAANAIDQALQAARAALELQERWPDARVALATGCGEAHSAEPSGDVIRAAEALLNGTSFADAIVLDDVSAGLLEHLFVLSRGLAGENVLVAQGGDRDVDDSTRPGESSSCLGRDAELSMIEAMLAGCRDDSKAEAMLIKGPQGIGKTHVRHEIVRRLHARQEDIEVWIGQLTALSAGAPYGLLSSAIFRLCQISASEAIDVQRQKLSAHIQRCPVGADRARITEFIGELCGVPFEDTESTRLRQARSDPRLMSREICSAFFDLLRAKCRVQPVLLILDNLQWADTLSVDLVGAALRELAELPLSVLALGRPEVTTLFPRLWADRVQEIALGGLSRKASERLVTELLRSEQPSGGTSKVLPASVLQRILAQAGGNPLFIQEIVRVAQRSASIATHADLPIPMTILAMLQARLSGLERGARRVVRAASLFGERFTRAGLSLLLGSESSDELDSWLRILREAEIIERTSPAQAATDVEYFFRHGLLREAAYSLLTRQDRRMGHELVAESLGQAVPAEPGTRPA